MKINFLSPSVLTGIFSALAWGSTALGKPAAAVILSDPSTAATVTSAIGLMLGLVSAFTNPVKAS